MLKTTSEELACPREDLSVARKEELRKLLLEQVPTVLGLLTGEDNLLMLCELLVLLNRGLSLSPCNKLIFVLFFWKIQRCPYVLANRQFRNIFEGS